MKKILCIVIVSLMLLMLVSGCSKTGISYKSLTDYSALDSDNPEQLLGSEPVTISLPERESHQTYIPVIVSAMSDSIWLPMKEGIDRAAREYNITVDYFVAADESDWETQAAAFKDVLTKNPQAICLIASDASKLTSYLNKTAAADIPIISLDSSIPSGCVAHCRANGSAVGEDAATRLAEAIRSRGKIAIAASDWKNVTSAEIIESFKNAVAANYPKIEVVNVPSNPDVSMLEQCSEFFAANPSIEAVFGVDVDSFECLISASKSVRYASGNDDSDDDDDEPRIIHVAGVGTNSVIINAIDSGDALGMYIVNYTDWGYNALTTAFSAYIGGEFESELLTDMIWVDESNIGLPSIQKLLNY